MNSALAAQVQPDEDRWRRGIVLLGLVAAGVLTAGLATHLGEPAVAASWLVGLVAWLWELLRPPSHPWQEATLLTVAGAAGGVLNALAPESSGFLLAYFAAAGLGLRLPLRPAFTALAVVVVTLDVGVAVALPAVLGSLTADDLGVAFTFVVAAAARNARRQHAQSALLLAEVESAREAESRAAALAERARLAREIHDILAHSLSGQVMTLEATAMLAERTGAEPRVVEGVRRAHQLAKSGLSQTRQAIEALRGDALPGPDRLPLLVAEARAGLGVVATLEVRGEPRPVRADVGLTLYRAAQEALTNTAKHAGRGAACALTLTWGPDHVALVARDRSPAGGSAGLPKSGYGLSGLRERVELAGGALLAAPAADGFEVRVTLPYQRPGDTS